MEKMYIERETGQRDGAWTQGMHVYGGEHLKPCRQRLNGYLATINREERPFLSMGSE